MKSPKVIFLDWNGTLSKSLFWEHLSDPANPLHSKFIEIESVLFNKENDLIIPWMKGEINSEAVCQFISKKINYDSNELLHELEISCRSMKLLNNQIAPILRQLKNKGIKIVIATDNMDTFSQYTFDEINKDNLFDDYLNSFDLGCLKYEYIKNNLPFFENYMKDHKLIFSDVVLIDDSVDKKGNYDRLGFKIVNVNENFSINNALRQYV